ncbi:MAG: hypothetical protein ACT443_15405 [Gemmatimonadota bacterium]
MKHASWLSLLAITLCACAGRQIIDKPVPFPEERIQLRREYIREHYGIESSSIEIVPRIIVLHWTAGRSFEGDFNTFVPARLRGRAICKRRER